MTRHVAAAVVGVLVAWLPAGAASAVPQVDLQTVVLGQLDGYQPAPAGVRPSGPLTDGEVAEFAPDAARRRLLTSSNTATYARSFVGGGQRRAVIAGFDVGTVARARSFVSGARERALDIGRVFPVRGVAHGFRVAVAPERTPGTSSQQVVVQSGPLVFAIVLSDVAAAPVSDANATQVARAQAAAVPKEVAAQEDASAAADIAREAAYAVAFLVPVALVTGAVVLVRRRH